MDTTKQPSKSNIAEMFRRLLEAAPDAMVVVNAQGEIVLANSQTEVLFGYPTAELIGRPVEMLMPERFRAEHTGHRLNFASLPKSRPMGPGLELFGVHRDGHEFQVEISLSPLETEHGLLVTSAIRDVTDRKRNEEALAEELRFQSLLSELSATFINIPVSQVDDQIRKAQKRICEELELDRSMLYQPSSEGVDGIVTHTWAAEGFEPETRLYGHDFPWSARTLLDGRRLSFVRIDDLPNEAAKDKESFRRHGVKSNVTFPLSAEGKVIGALAFGSLRGEREWPASVLERLGLVAQVFSNALSRKRAEETRRESEERFRLVANAAPVLIWMSGTDKLCHFFNQTWITFTGRAMEQELGEGWVEGVHPEDVNHCLETYSEAFDARAAFSMEYRLRRFDGEYRWVVDAGVPRFESNGTFLGYIGSCIDFSARKLAEQALLAASDRLAEANQEIAKLNERLEHENIYLREEIKLQHDHFEVIGQSEPIRRLLLKAEQVATTDSTVLLLGETGTGKELIATTIHELSRRKNRPMVKVNCAALPATLVESELFGREKGAYTGALTREMGRFELANDSTIFLDEIGELPFELQAKLLRVLQEGEFERLGSSKTIRVSVRVIAATSRDLNAEVKEGKFREDLFYRLNVFPIHVPPLRDRREDIPMLAWHFIRTLGTRMGRNMESIRASTMKSFQNYSWPGNVRELRNVIERHLITNTGSVFSAEVLGPEEQSGLTGQSLEAVERAHILNVLGTTGWRVRGRGGASEILGLKPTTLESRMEKLGIARTK